jgi:hypothetical protein
MLRKKRSLGGIFRLTWLLYPDLPDCAIVRALSIVMDLGSFNRSRPWSFAGTVIPPLALLLILVLFISNVEAWKPATFFGRYADDALYFSCAQALAQHRGYILPSFPGIPLKPQVPILYPLLLSEVWKISPQFPENIIWAIRLTEGFGCLALLGTFFLLRRVAGLAVVPSLILTAVCAFHPVLVRLSGLTMTDVPFAAMFLLVVLLAQFALSPGISLGPTATLGVVAALSASLRSLGYMVAVGLLAYILYRREYRRALAYSFAAGVTVLSVLFLTAHYAPMGASGNAVPSNRSGSQWERLVVFHTEYVRFHWRMGIPTIGAFFSMIKENCLQLVSSPGPFLAGAFDRHSWLLTAGMSAIVLSGVVRLLRRPEWRALAFITIPYIFLVILWPYPLMDRFLLPLLPIFLLATVLESKRLLSLAMSNLAPSSSWANRILAVCLCAILLGYAVFSGWTYLFRDRQALREAANVQAKTLAQKREVYSWIRDHTPANAKIVAYDDNLLFLYTQRQALRPIAMLPTAAYSKGADSNSPDLDRDLAQLCDAPRDAGATYWLVTGDDFSLDADPEKTTSRQNEIVGALPLAFRSSGGFARLYDSSCLLSPTRKDCEGTQAVLVPGTR